MWNRVTIMGLLVTMAVAGVGCSRSSELSGTVPYRYRPLAFGTVQVRGADGMVRAVTIGPDGCYKIPELPTGITLVSVTCRDPHEMEFLPELTGRERGGVRSRRPAQSQTTSSGADAFSLIPTDYADLDRSGLSFTLATGANQFDIDLR